MKRMNRSTGILFGLAAVTTALTGFAVPAASAATPQVTAGCYASSCSGRDPIQMGCNADAYTVESVSSAYGTIELRYSSSCKANWARISGASNGQLFWVENSSDIQFWNAIGSTGYGDMVDGSGSARACISGNGPCTGWH
ncbi:DUF2690 domain-containing protein [Kitasatospora sp. NPDC057512]|uniref:DUF2690 domain-containing protein n=1 Tax=Kitasatospora sp. NPDC057512 TaxID=3346154 RepID=UPI0036784BDC